MKPVLLRVVIHSALALALLAGVISPHAWAATYPDLSLPQWPVLMHDMQRTGYSPVYGPADNQTKWQYTTAGQVYSSPAVGQKGIVYVGGMDGNFYAFNPDGTARWFRWLGVPVVASPAVGPDGTVYVSASDGKLYSFTADGVIKWTFSVGGATSFSSPAFSPEGNIYVGGADGKLYAIRQDGTLIWSVGLNAPVTSSSPAVGRDGTIYIAAGERLFALTPGGSLLWSFTSASTMSAGPTVAPDGTIYVGSTVFYALWPNGTVRWTYMAGYQIQWAPAVGPDGTVYLATGSLLAFYPDGSLKWSLPSSYFLSTSPIVDGRGFVYVGALNHYFYSISPDGTVAWRYGAAAANVSWSTASLASDGTLYVGGWDGKVYAFGGSKEFYELKFVASSLPEGTWWGVTVNGLTIVGNGSVITFDYLLPGLYNWSVAPVYLDAGTRYGPSPSFGTLDVPSQLSLSLVFTKQHFLSITSAYGDPIGAGWHDAGASVFFGVQSEVSGGPGRRFVFVSWSGSGDGSYSGTLNSSFVTMNGPITEVAQWKAQYYLNVTSAFGLVYGQGWHDEGSLATFGVATPFYGPPGVRYVFTSWTGYGQWSFTGPDNPAKVTMLGPVLEVANWKAQYLLTVNSTYGSPFGGGWYDPGSVANVGVYSPYQVGPGVRYVFVWWMGSGLGSYEGPLANVSLVVYNPMYEEAIWNTQYYLNVSSTFGPVSGGGWYSEGAEATFSAPPIAEGTPLTRGTFLSWLGSGTGSYTGPNRTATAVVNGPITEVAVWMVEHYVTIIADPSQLGSVSPSSGWYVEGTELQLLAVPQAGYTFVSWEGAGDGSYSGNSSAATAVVRSPLLETAHFEVLVTVVQAGLPEGYSWAVTVGKETFASRGDSMVIHVPYGTNPWNATDVIQHDEWTRYLALVSSGLIDSSTQKALSISYRAQYYVLVRASPKEGVLNLTSSGWRSPGDVVVLTASVAPGWFFHGWNGEGTGSYSGPNITAQLIVGGPLNETCTTYPGLTVRSSAGGYVEYRYGDVKGMVPEGGTIVLFVPQGTVISLWAYPSVFLNSFTTWSGAFENYSQPASLSVDRPNFIEANFSFSYVNFVVTVSILYVVLLVLFLTLRRWRARRLPPLHVD